jgi:methionyl-tRNA formyltransferase
MRVVFLGSDPIALPLLEALVAPGTGVEIVGVFTQPDRPVGRGQQVKANAIKEWARARGLPVRQPERLTPDVREELAGWRPDVSLVMAYGHILKDDFIATPRLGTLNLHTSILPKYRGASPIQTAIAQGERETGVSLMRIVRALDAGPVAAVERVAIETLDTATEVERKLASACVPLVLQRLPALAEGALSFVEQDAAAATYCRRLTKADGVLDFAAPARVLAARINGLFPWPGCTIEIAGQLIKLGLADVGPGEEGAAAEIAPGTVLAPDAEGLRVTTGEGLVRLRRLQRPGGRMLPATEFLRGFVVPDGTVIPSQPMPPLVSDQPFR